MTDLWSHDVACLAGSEDYWRSQSLYPDSSFDVIPGAAVFNRVSLVFKRASPSPYVEDVAVTSLAITKTVLAGEYVNLVGAEMSSIETLFNTWWTTNKAWTSNKYTLDQYRWHQYTLGNPKPGPAVRVTSVGVAGSLVETASLPDQVATSITFKTAGRKHWGRCYMPKVGASDYDTYGRLTQARTDAIALSWDTLLNGIDDGSISPIVASNTHGGMLAISSLQVDNTADVVRRRRAKQTSYRKEYTS